MNIKNKNLGLLLLSVLAIMLLSACASTRSYTPNVAERTAAASSVDALNRSSGIKQAANNSQTPTSKQYQAPVTGANLNVGDVLDVSVFKVADLSAQNLTVEASGTISLPLVGSVAVAGLSIGQAEQKITQKLTKFMQAPQVSISRTNKSIEKRVTVEGEVRTPGVFPIQGNLSFLQAIALAQGLSDVGDSRNVFFFRNGQRYPVNLDLVRNGTIADPVLQNDDRIVVMKDLGKQREKKILEYIPVLTSPFSFFR
ncbi:MAG: polysaccharide biosynthesis/export family protein [Cocleimonas sp.]